MDLPIDHFRLLRVSPTTDLQSVLRTLEQRIDRPPDEGFTLETLEARAELLRSSADLLTDPERRRHYELELTALDASGDSLQAALDVPATKEVAGLVLLLEAGMALDCFELASQALQPPQTPALGSVREADLSLVAGLACLQAAQDLRQERRYEAAAQVLGEGNQLLQRVGQQGELRQQMAEDRRILRPYRVLDLLSRDLAASRERSQGLTLLNELLQDRGGLDGRADPDLSPEDFQAFLRQIRAFLTVQEQLDLFERWASRSASADVLAATALTALGFAQRKPERIAAARSRLLARDSPELQPQLACLDLLLGEVESAQQRFTDGASKDLQDWAARQSDDPLAQVCAFCRDWLARDVLPGYRDLEADADLEAYFADRDVQAYLERLETGGEPAAPTEAGSILGGGLLSPFSRTGGALPSAQALLGFGPLDAPHALAAGSGGQEHEEDEDEGPEEAREPLVRRWRRPALLLAGALATVLVALGLLALLRPRPTTVRVEPASEGAAAEPKPMPTEGGTPDAAVDGPEPAPALPLRAAQPSSAQIQTLLETWLTAKSAVLAGNQPAVTLDQLAQPSQLRLLQAERRSDEALGHTKRIDTSVENLRLESSSPQRISAVASIRYRAERLDGEGQRVGQPSDLTLRNRYVFSSEGNSWRVVSFERVN
ncbi:MAG: ARC6/PARC6 family protein [Cyanobacteria bacterium J06638_7]